MMDKKTFWVSFGSTAVLILLVCVLLDSAANTLYGDHLFGLDFESLLLEVSALFAVSSLVGYLCVQQKRLKRIEEKLDELLSERRAPEEERDAARKIR